jgi:hypothetical protein
LSKLKNIFLISIDSKQGAVKKDISHLNLKFKTDNAEVNVLVSNNLSHEQNLEYMDKVLKTMIELEKTQIHNLQTYEIYVIDSDEDNPELLKVMTDVQYCNEQRKKNQKK